MKHLLALLAAILLSGCAYQVGEYRVLIVKDGTQTQSELKCTESHSDLCDTAIEWSKL
jgi:hypothetical protein